ncbi:MAG: metallophosphoesterase family protein [Desulfurococcaceae archaeon]
MNILAISDVHEKISKVNGLRLMLKEMEFIPEVVVVAGDLTYFKNVDIALKILRKIRELLGSRVLFVPGNCDPPDLIEIKEVGGNIINIHSRIIEVGGYIFYGIGGSGITPFNTLIEYSDEEFEEMLRTVDLIHQKERLIMVTHQPISGYFDEISGINVGSRVFAKYLTKLKPLLWITGHIHEHSGVVGVDGTTIVHPGPLMKGYFALIEVINSAVKNVEIYKLKE